MPSQYAEIVLDEFENRSCTKLEFLSKLLREQGFNYSICDVDRLCHDRAKTIELTRFERSLHKKDHENFSEIDTIIGYEFEDFLVTLFTYLGYTVEQRKKSHEQGLDRLLLRYGERTAVQVKRYSKPVGNKAIQEVNATRM